MVPGAERFLMLVVVAVHTEQFPVAPIRRVVMVVVVLVMNGQFAQVLAREIPPAATAHMWKHGQRLFAVALFAFRFPPTDVGENF